ncbi:MAG: thiamine biosynthesis protein ThiS [Gammaproteobacteria bacterium]|nr:thiamine biosynthesis protein ThiS [Gammaproteobacteria bacterium]|tara:strand:- start:538 stop:747 length:210 start_codon:yes stop_codon:yes gene_type:complete
MNKIKIKVNGEDISISSNLTLSNLLLERKLSENNIAIELNGEVISKDLWINKIIKEDDSIEIITAIGGG